ncbi:hypothetical protein [Nocardia sp. Marseille-Q1738]
MTTFVAVSMIRSLRSLIPDTASLSLGSVMTTMVAASITRSLRSLILVDLPSAPVAAGC